MRYRLPLALIALTISGGCGPGSGASTPATQGAEPQVAPPAAVAVATPQTGIWFEPAGLSECARPEKVMVNWDAKAFDGVKAVDIVAVSATGKETIFLSAGRFGSRESGQWMRAGSQMILRNHADGSELARATVAAIPCDK